MEVVGAQKTRYILVHGWDDDPSSGWLGWLQRELREREAVVLAPRFPVIKRRADIPVWQVALDGLVAEIRSGDILVAHSLGCWEVLRAVERLGSHVKVAKAVLVAGFYDAPDARAQEFFSPEPDWAHLRAVVGEWQCILSRDDTVVLPERSRALARKLDAELIELDGYGHFLGSRGMQEFQELLDLLIRSEL